MIGWDLVNIFRVHYELLWLLNDCRIRCHWPGKFKGTLQLPEWTLLPILLLWTTNLIDKGGNVKEVGWSWWAKDWPVGEGHCGMEVNWTFGIEFPLISSCLVTGNEFPSEDLICMTIEGSQWQQLERNRMESGHDLIACKLFISLYFIRMVRPLDIHRRFGRKSVNWSKDGKVSPNWHLIGRCRYEENNNWRMIGNLFAFPIATREHHRKWTTKQHRPLQLPPLHRLLLRRRPRNWIWIKCDSGPEFVASFESPSI